MLRLASQAATAALHYGSQFPSQSHSWAYRSRLSMLRLAVNGGNYVVLPTPGVLAMFEQWTAMSADMIKRNEHDQQGLDRLNNRAWKRCTGAKPCAAARDEVRPGLPWLHPFMCIAQHPIDAGLLPMLCSWTKHTRSLPCFGRFNPATTRTSTTSAPSADHTWRRCSTRATGKVSRPGSHPRCAGKPISAMVLMRSCCGAALGPSPSLAAAPLHCAVISAVLFLHPLCANYQQKLDIFKQQLLWFLDDESECSAAHLLVGGCSRLGQQRGHPVILPQHRLKPVSCAECLPSGESKVLACQLLRWRDPDVELHVYSCPSYGLGLQHERRQFRKSFSPPPPQQPPNEASQTVAGIGSANATGSEQAQAAAPAAQAAVAGTG